jgi:hypothetical protein
MDVHYDAEVAILLLVELGSEGNLMGAVMRNPDGPWHIVYRFRWYRDKLIGPDSQDVRNESMAMPPEGMPPKLARDYAMMALDMVFEMSEIKYGVTRTVVAENCSGEESFQKLAQVEGVYVMGPEVSA